MAGEELPLFTFWEATVGDLFDRTAKIPKSARFTFTARIENQSLDVLEALVEAHYATPPRKQTLLREIDLRLAVLRVLLRLAHARRLLDPRSYEHLARRIDEAGRMIGGWRRQQATR